jgi:hypothetical protein
MTPRPLTITLKGPAALAVVGLALLWLIASGVQRPLPREGRRALEFWLRAEYTRNLYAQRGEAPVDSAYIAQLNRLNSVTVPSATMRGLRGRRRVRATIAMPGGPPPDGETVRYFEMSRSILMDGWLVHRNSAWIFWVIPL